MTPNPPTMRTALVGVTLHDDGTERLGEHDQVAFGTGRSIEHSPCLVGRVSMYQPARLPVGVSPGGGDIGVTDWP